MLGERVILNEMAHEELAGKTGTIICVERDVIGIELDELLYLHNCNGKCKNGHGWYCQRGHFELEGQSPLCRLILKNDELLKKIRSNELDGINVRHNGKLLIYTKEDGTKLIVIRESDKKILSMTCKDEMDRIVILHIIDSKRVKEGFTLDESYNWVEYSEKEEQKLLKELQSENEQEELNVEPPVTAQSDLEAKEEYFETEEEMLKAYGVK